MPRLLSVFVATILAQDRLVRFNVACRILATVLRTLERSRRRPRGGRRDRGRPILRSPVSLPFAPLAAITSEWDMQAAPDDGPSREFLRRVEHLKAESPPAEWDGVWTLREK